REIRILTRFSLLISRCSAVGEPVIASALGAVLASRLTPFACSCSTISATSLSRLVLAALSMPKLSDRYLRKSAGDALLRSINSMVLVSRKEKGPHWAGLLWAAY